MEEQQRLTVTGSDSNGLVNSSSSSTTIRSTTPAGVGYSSSRASQQQQLIPYGSNLSNQQRVPLHVHHSQINGSMHGPLSFERKSLLAATSVTVIGSILMLVAVCTDYWLIITNPGGPYLTHDRIYRMSSHSGIFTICNMDYRNETPPVTIGTDCMHHILFPSEHEANTLQHEFDRTSLDYTRSEVAFSTISIILMIIGQGFAFYSFKERRYMFKRITALLHFLSAICVLICIEVLVSSVTYEKHHLKFRHPPSSVHHFGFSFVLACVACAAFFIAGIIFLIFSRKKKEEKNVTEMKTFDGDVEQHQQQLSSMAALNTDSAVNVT